MSRTIRWFDCNGVELFEGDRVRDLFTGREEVVYACHPDGYPDTLSLGVNASNEKFLELHPNWAREVYPFSNFKHKRIPDGYRLLHYEKVV